MASKRRKDIKTVRLEPPESAGTRRGFLRRWSERKAQVRAGEELPASSETPVNDLVSPAPVDEPAPPLTDADMPPIDTLDEKSDYSDFFSPRVSDDLRRLALRKLFHLPGFNIRDGLDDYDEDYRTFEALGNIVTAHDRHLSEMQQQDNNKEPLASEKPEAERATLTENDGTLVEDPKKSEGIADETASTESEDTTEDLDGDTEHARHG
jgi:hypothetical protein